MQSGQETIDPDGNASPDGHRRDFLVIAATAFVGVGAAAAMWPFIDSMNPAADVKAFATVEIDLAPIQLGQRVTVLWQGKPMFIVHRTSQEINLAEAADNSASLIDPELDAKRIKRKEWLIVIGICTHLGCVPRGEAPQDNRGDYGGWFCPCHGSEYDTSGRVRRGPAPLNLAVPPYHFVSDTKIVIG